MELLSHRGFWKTPNQKNTKEANALSFSNAWGIETDIRDYKEELVISHDIAVNNNYTLQFLLEQYVASGKNGSLALNIKADGLSKQLASLLNKYNVSNYFAFDMSIPETLRYLNEGLNVFIRYSEYEIPNAELYERSTGIWLDIFKSRWYDNDFVNLHLSHNKMIAFVSPELHGRDQDELWKMIKENKWNQSSQTMLCTDFADAAKKYFNL